MNAAAKTASLRALLRSKAVRIAGALLVIYTVSGFLLAPWLVRSQFPSLVEKYLGGKGSVAAVRINPFLLTFEARDLEIAENSGPPALRSGRIFVDFEASSLLRWAWTFREIRIERPVIHADLDARESLNLARLLTHRPADAEAAAQAAPAGGLPRLLLQQFVIAGGVFGFTDRTVAPEAQAQVSAIDFEMQDISTLPDHRGEHRLSARVPGGGSLQWQGQFTLVPIDSSGTLTLRGGKLATLWQFVRDHLAIAEPGGSYEAELRYRMRYDKAALELQADNIAFRIKDLAIAQQQGGAVLGKLAGLALEGGSFDLQQRSLTFSEARIAEGTINLGLDVEGKPDWAKLLRNTPAAAQPAVTAPAPAAAAATAAKPWQVALPKISIGPLALAVTDLSRVKPLRVTVAGAEAGFGLAAAFGSDKQVTIDNGAVKTGDIRIRSGDDKEPLLTMATVELAGGEFDLQKNAAQAALLRVTGGKTRVNREADGRINLGEAFTARRPAPAADSGSAFSLTLDRAEVAGHAIAFADRSFRPAVAYDLEQIGFSLSKIAVPFKHANPVELNLRIRQGGTLQAKGVVDLLRQSADIRVTAKDIALAPLQPALNQYTTLTLASGKAGAAGRITWNGKSNPVALRYAGAAAITDIDLKIKDSGERLLSWQRFAASDILFDSARNRLAIAQLSIARPYARLIINKDRSTNLGGIMRPRTASAAPAPAEKTPATPMAISLDRVSVERGAMDFSDLSLVLPFETHIKTLGGSVSGLSSAPDSRASLKFEGRIEDTGLARAEGTIQPFAPKKFTDIAVTFRNVALTPLSPYTATFAGRKIASGRLSLDLQYKLDNSQLAGDNKVLLEQFTLGERVESPTAVNLPLDLAIALLTDSEGRIDLAIPVTGNVDHPEFSYGPLIWQAIRTVITGIVTAPFRALGALFGGNAETLSDIVFDPGSARILPTEYEKLRRVAEGLQKRPQLKLVVQGRYHSENDSLALRTQALRADLAAREGLKLAPGEDPGPVGFDNPKTQRALEIMLNERAGGEAAAQFAEAFRKTAGREAGRVNALLAVMGRGAGDRELYVAMHRRLVELQPLPEAALPELARAREAAITRAFTARLKFEAARLGSKPVEAVDEAVKNGVPVKLSFEAAP